MRNYCHKILKEKETDWSPSVGARVGIDKYVMNKWRRKITWKMAIKMARASYLGLHF